MARSCENVYLFSTKVFKDRDFFELTKSKFILRYDDEKWYLTENYQVEAEKKRVLLDYYGTQMDSICNSVINFIEKKGKYSRVG